MSFRLVPKSETLNDLERRNGRYIELFHWNSQTCVPTHRPSGNRVDVWRNLVLHASVVYFAVRVRCRRKESLRSLSHLLMSFLFLKVKAKDIKKISRPTETVTVPLQAKICIAVSDSLTYRICLFNKTQCKRNDLWRFWCSIFKLMYKNKVLEPHGLRGRR